MKKLELKLKKKLSGKNIGNFKSYFKGEGLEIEDFRQYQHGDDVRNLNWKLSAKNNKFFVNLYKQEKDIDIDVFFDINPNWKSGVNENNFLQISELFIELCNIAKKYGANINSYYYFDNKIKNIPINGDIYNVYYVLKTLKKSLNEQKNKYVSFLSSFLKFQKRITKKHLIVIFSDFLDINYENIKTIKFLDIRNEIFLHKITIDNSYGYNYNSFILKKTDSELIKILQSYSL